MKQLMNRSTCMSDTQGQQQHPPLRLTLGTLDVNQAPSQGATSDNGVTFTSPPSFTLEKSGSSAASAQPGPSVRALGHRRGSGGRAGSGGSATASGASGYGSSGCDERGRAAVGRSFSFSGFGELHQQQQLWDPEATSPVSQPLPGARPRHFSPTSR